MNYKNILYSLACLTFTIVIGGAVYEHIAVVPQWSAAPPASLAMFQGSYGVTADLFWMSIHPVTLVFFFATLIVSWKTDRRLNILATFIGYVIILIATATYFVPELLGILGTPYSDSVDNDLTKRAGMWESLSIFRLVIMIILSLVLFTGLTKSHEKSYRHD